MISEYLGPICLVGFAVLFVLGTMGKTTDDVKGAAKKIKNRGSGGGGGGGSSSSSSSEEEE